MNQLKVTHPENQSELSDIQAMACGDVQGFNRLYARYHQSIHSNILKLVKSAELSNELLQDVFLALWQNRFKFADEESVGGWLFVVSYNKSLNVLRKKVQESIEYVAEYSAEMMLQEEDTLEKEELYRMQMELLEEAVAVLPARKKEVFKLCRYEGRSKEDVAELLGISPQSVTDYLKQSNKSIKDYVLNRYPTYVGNLLVFLLFIH